MESVYAGNRIWGSNPHLSASFKLKADISAFFLACSINNSASQEENINLWAFILKTIIMAENMWWGSSGVRPMPCERASDGAAKISSLFCCSSVYSAYVKIDL